MKERTKEHERDIRLACSQNSEVSDHEIETAQVRIPVWVQVKFFDHELSLVTRRVKEAIHTGLHPNNINRDSGIEILEAWMPTIK